MAFINKEDYASIINENILDDITEVDDDKIERAEKRAINFVSGYLNSRYDVNAIFSQSGDSRNQTILGYTMDITIFYLHRLIDWRKTPSERVKAYNDAKEWLVKVNELQINPGDLPVLPDGSKDFIMFGSNPKRQNHI